jgi:GNAT superfamily N-acetyltransferase
MEIVAFDREALEARKAELAALLHDCVMGGASVNFIAPFSAEAATAFWDAKVAPGLEKATLTLLCALENGRVAGSVQLDCDTPPNQAHRADVKKLLVHPDFRRRGLARALMERIEQVARSKNRDLLTLDTAAGSAAEPLYHALGYTALGTIPGYARAVHSSALDGATFFYKAL